MLENQREEDFNMEETSDMEHEISNQELFLQLRTAQEQIQVLQEKQEEFPVVQTFQLQLAQIHRI